MLKNIFTFLVLSFIATFSIALGLADFAPGFMTAEPIESSDPNLPVKPLVNTKRNASSPHNSWYCNRIKNGPSNVFCKDDATAASHVITYESSNGADRSRVVDVTNQAAQTTSNQSALLDQSTRNEMDKAKNNFSLPIQPSKNVNMNVGQNQVDFNIKY